MAKKTAASTAKNKAPKGRSKGYASNEERETIRKFILRLKKNGGIIVNIEKGVSISVNGVSMWIDGKKIPEMPLKAAMMRGAEGKVMAFRKKGK